MNHRSDCVLIQQASGDYKPLLELTVGRHLAYCRLHNMDYWPIFGEARSRLSKTLPHYDRATLLETALEAGYKKVIWLDADSVIYGGDDMREAVPHRGIGALWCEGKWEPPMYDHFCTGVLYVRNSAESRFFMRVWKETDCKNHGWQDQHAFNQMLSTFEWAKGFVKKIDRHWHTILPNYPPLDSRPPAVVAFHGYGDLETRLQCMRSLFGQEVRP